VPRIPTSQGNKDRRIMIQASPSIKSDLISKVSRAIKARTGDLTQVVQSLLGNHKALNPTLSITKQKQTNKKEMKK
jgi:ABC-type enterochelin transport system ATPase subunit